MTALIVPDLHGHFPRFQAALRAAGQQRPLIFLGDLIDDSPRRRQARGDTSLAGTPDDSRATVAEPRSLDRAASSRDERTAAPRGRSAADPDRQPDRDEDLDADRRASA